jgi:CMP-N-acetylneuraminic acid synthetase
MSRKKITAVIPIRKGSQRVPNKNFKEFHNGKNLLEIKIEDLLKVHLIDEIVVNTDSDDAIDIAKKYGVSAYKREDYYASSNCSQSEFFRNLAETTDSDIIIHTPCTSPLVKINTMYDAINRFMISENDSCNAVGSVKEYLWLNNKPLNYKIINNNVPNSQDLPDVMKLTFGFNILSKKLMIERSNVVGYNPLFYLVDDIEETDIDTQLDFDFAKFLYSKNKIFL